MKGIILHILYASKRDALFFGTTLFVLFCTAISCFLGMNASVETNEAKIIYTAGMSRIAIIIGFTIFVIFYIKRMFDNHEIEVILTRSISRTKIILGLFVGFMITLLKLLLPAFIILLLLKTNITSLCIWLMSVLGEGLIVLTFAICCSLMIKSQVYSLLFCVLFYCLGRGIGAFVAYISLSFQTSFYNMICSLLKIISILVPRLDLFGKTSWLVYNDVTITDIGLFLSQMLLFCGIFLSIAIIDFRKKEF